MFKLKLEDQMLKQNYSLLKLVALFIIFSSTSIFAQSKPIQLAFFTPVQIFPEENPISGVRFNLIYGRNISVTGLDLGLVNHTTKDLSKGVQFGLVGLVDSDFIGWQNNWINITKNNFEGFQWGIVNYANFANGLQLGIVNYTGSMKGLQIGLVNIIKEGGAFPFFPIVNWSF